MEDTQSVLLGITLVVMIGAVFASVIPLIPGPTLIWAIALVYAAITQTLPIGSIIIMTFLMLIGASSDYWLPLIGVRTHGLSCLGAVGSLVGGILGTLLIPVPILGTIIGSIAGSMLVEFAKIRQLSRALQAGHITLKLYLWGAVVQFCVSLLILLTFVGTLITLR